MSHVSHDVTIHNIDTLIMLIVIIPVFRMQSHMVQRSNFVDDTSYYQNKQKKAFRSLAKK